MLATLIGAKNISYVSDINCCCKTLVMAAILIVLAKLFATALMPVICSNNFFAAKNTFYSNLAFLVSLPKTIFLVVLAISFCLS
jgi:hypothetical protein